jgi:hypothetical protein
MAMRTMANNLTIASYSEQLRNRQIIINHDYQRTDKVWPISAKSNLIDTILAGYPIPKLILSQRTDLATRKTRQELVDGQQRTAAIIEFLGDKFSLSRGNLLDGDLRTSKILKNEISLIMNYRQIFLHRQPTRIYERSFAA